MKSRIKIARGISNLAYLRGGIWLMLLWPCLAGLLGVATWLVMSSMLAEERNALRAEAARQATALARQYGRQLDRAIDQIDQIALNFKVQWEQAGTPAALAGQVNTGVYPLSAQLYILLVDADGRLLRTTLDSAGAVDLSDRPYFRQQKSGAAPELLITQPMLGRITGKESVVFSRRVDGPGQGFAGLVVVSVETAYLAPHMEQRDLGKGDFLAVADDSGLVYAGRANNASLAKATLRQPQLLKQASGERFVAARDFNDNTARFLAWTRLEKHGLVAIAGISEAQAMAPLAATRDRFRDIGTGIAAFLLLFALTGMVFAARLLWRKQQAEEVRNTYRMAVDAAREGFYMVRPVHDGAGAIVDFEVADCNQRGANYYGMQRDELLGRRFTSFSSAGAYVQEVIRVFSQAMATGYYEDELQVPESSPLRPVWLHRRLMRSQDGLAVTLRDISELKAHEKALSRMANEDALTGLPNRNWLSSWLPVALEQARAERRRLALLFIDLDSFKDVNDTLGHATGDALLKAVAMRLRALVPAGQHLVRLGGDEFTIVMPDAGGREQVAAAAAGILAGLGEDIVLEDGSRHQVHASAGASLYPDDGADADTLQRHADIALYEAKARARGGVLAFHAEFSDRLVLRLRREQALRGAIARDEFVLYYQPRVDAMTGELRSMEALVRWIHPERGLVPPLEFIDTAERTGMIVELGELVIRKACAQLAAWKAAGLRMVPVSVNVSPRQFSEKTLGAVLGGQLAWHGIEAGLLEVEVTESGIMGDSDDTAANLAHLKKLDIRLLVDDFGTGYASLSQLQRLRLDGLKVDRSFTTALALSREGEVFYRAIVSMAHALGMSVVAEGVETDEELRLLQALGCDEVQGYLVSRPVPAAQAASFMDQRFLFAPHAAAAMPATGAGRHSG